MRDVVLRGAAEPERASRVREPRSLASMLEGTLNVAEIVLDRAAGKGKARSANQILERAGVKFGQLDLAKCAKRTPASLFRLSKTAMQIE